jgi:hypothetical protein
MSSGALLVGEAPNRAGQGRRANTTLTGGRIARLHPRAGGLARTNLLRAWPGPQGKGSAFPLDLARPAASRLLARTPAGVPLLLVGTRVAAAFGLARQDYEYLEWMTRSFVRSPKGCIGVEPWEAPRHAPREVAVLPHPSGIVLWWNDPENVEAALEFFARLLGHGGRRNGARE